MVNKCVFNGQQRHILTHIITKIRRWTMIFVARIRYYVFFVLKLFFFFKFNQILMPLNDFFVSLEPKPNSGSTESFYWSVHSRARNGWRSVREFMSCDRHFHYSWKNRAISDGSFLLTYYLFLVLGSVHHRIYTIFVLLSSVIDTIYFLFIFNRRIGQCIFIFW